MGNLSSKNAHLKVVSQAGMSLSMDQLLDHTFCSCCTGMHCRALLTWPSTHWTHTCALSPTRQHTTHSICPLHVACYWQESRYGSLCYAPCVDTPVLAHVHADTYHACLTAQNASAYKTAERILVEMGQYFQVGAYRGKLAWGGYSRSLLNCLCSRLSLSRLGQGGILEHTLACNMTSLLSLCGRRRFRMTTLTALETQK